MVGSLLGPRRVFLVPVGPAGWQLSSVVAFSQNEARGKELRMHLHLNVADLFRDLGPSLSGRKIVDRMWYKYWTIHCADCCDGLKVVIDLFKIVFHCSPLPR
ncbi:hypothetical protein NPIL_451731 [Nephila pilipes]|uniref:Uncharacterized protein n=1 Tax=Nephila pilipes TaxID=299642 RepID=A0A8X6TDJ3_NEPPI|nr:hypothetical protein NPIL_451731 [Nephila pilipes]